VCDPGCLYRPHLLQLHVGPAEGLEEASAAAGQHRDNVELKHVEQSRRDRLRRHLFGTRAARLGTVHELTKLAPVAIVAEALGYSAKTIESHASASGADYARYVDAIVGNE